MRKRLLGLQVGLVKDGVSIGILESTRFNHNCKEDTGLSRARVDLLIVNRGVVLCVHDEHRCDLLSATTGRIVNLGNDLEVVLAHLRRGAHEGSGQRVE